MVMANSTAHSVTHSVEESEKQIPGLRCTSSPKCSWLAAVSNTAHSKTLMKIYL